jgi:hypothetical protein
MSADHPTIRDIQGALSEFKCGSEYTDADGIIRGIRELGEELRECRRRIIQLTIENKRLEKQVTP